MKLSLVTSLYASAPYVDELYTRAVAAISAIGAEHEIIFVNDASPDDALDRAKAIAERDPSVVVVDLARNVGQHRALVTGLRMATGDLIWICDSDLEEAPEWIAEFHPRMVETGADVVFGVHERGKGSAGYRLARRSFYRSLEVLTDAQFPRNVTTARLMSRRYLDAFLSFRESEIWLTGLFHMTGFLQLPVSVTKGDTSPSTYTLSKLVPLYVNAVTSFSVRPLAFIGVAGIILFALAALMAFIVVIRQLVFGIATEGWASLVVVNLAIGGLTILFNGIIAVYVGKIFLEVKSRPLSVVREVFRRAEDGEGPR